MIKAIFVLLGSILSALLDMLVVYLITHNVVASIGVAVLGFLAALVVLSCLMTSGESK